MINATNNIIETRHTAEAASKRADAHGVYLFTYDSEGARSLVGIEPREIYGNENVGYEIVHPNDLAPLLKSIRDSKDAKVLTDNGLKYINLNEKSIFGAQINCINVTRTFCRSENGETKYGKSQNEDNGTTFYFSLPYR